MPFFCRIGFTGTRKGMSPKQLLAAPKLLARQHDATELHHGDCVGADAEMHKIASKLGLSITVHPPINPDYRAFCEGNIVLPLREYLERNRDIVNSTDMLIATPYEVEEQLRSGTWSTIRFARTRRKRVLIIRPDGTVIAT